MQYRAALVGEFAVRMLRDSGAEIELIPAESFIDAVLEEVGYDPLDRGLQILDGHELPQPLVLDKPTIIAQLDQPEVLADVAAQIGRVLPQEAKILMLAGMAAADTVRLEASPDESIPLWPDIGRQCSSTPIREGSSGRCGP